MLSKYRGPSATIKFADNTPTIEKETRPRRPRRSRCRRVCDPHRGQRLVGCRRRRLPVLLDHGVHQGERQGRGHRRQVRQEPLRARLVLPLLLASVNLAAADPTRVLDLTGAPSIR